MCLAELSSGLPVTPLLLCGQVGRATEALGRNALNAKAKVSALWITMQDTGRTRGSLLIDPRQYV